MFFLGTNGKLMFFWDKWKINGFLGTNGKLMVLWDKWKINGFFGTNGKLMVLGVPIHKHCREFLLTFTYYEIDLVWLFKTSDIVS